MRLRLGARLLGRSLLRPEPLLAMLMALAALVYWLQGTREARPTPPTIEIAAVGEEALEPSEVRLVRYDAQGLEVPGFVQLQLPAAPAARLSAILSALREASLGDAWPEGLPVPNVFVENIGRRNVAFLDFRPEGALALSVRQERRLLDSLEATVLANGVDEIRYLRGGEATGVFLEHLAVPAGL